jgi:signal transduction histidine kinase/FixJ family two-component response regulator
MMEIAMREGSHYYEWMYQRLSGAEFPATVLLTRLEIDDKPVLQATVRDETEVKRLQAMLRQSDRLASMGMLAASVAHEINNPLTYVLYNIESLVIDLPQISTAVQRCLRVLREQIGDEAFSAVVADDADRLDPAMLLDIAERSMEAREGAQRIQTIAKAIGTFSRLESTRRSRVDLNSAIESAVAMARTALKARAKLVVDFGQLPPVWASEGKLSQVFLNLLINAAQAIEEGSSAHNEVEVRTWANGDQVYATVTDSGKGVPKENLARIFEPFFTTKPAGVGSGLGLCICRNIVTDFGGDISVESEPGEGTRFIVRMPVQQSVAPAARIQPTSEPAVSGTHGRILVVDDEPAIRTMLVHILGTHHEVITAESGEEARALLAQDQAFDLILCDLMMHEMTGMALHGWLATQYPALAAQLVFISGGAFTPRALEYVQRVGNRLVQKPFEVASLTRLVSEMIGVGGSADAAQSRPISAVHELLPGAARPAAAQRS